MRGDLESVRDAAICGVLVVGAGRVTGLLQMSAAVIEAPNAHFSYAVSTLGESDPIAIGRRSPKC